MSTLSQGSHAFLILNPGDMYRVSAAGTTRVSVLYGAPSAVVSLVAATQDFGPYDAPTKLQVEALIDSADYWTRATDAAAQMQEMAADLHRLALVAWTGTYTDLLSRPTIPDAQVQADWSAVSGMAAIANKPTTVATAGLTDAVTNVGLASSLSSYVTASSMTSALSGYATAAAVTAALGGKMPTPTGTTAQYIRGDGSLADFPLVTAIQRIRAQTNAAGLYVWTFPVPYAAGVIPVVECSVEGAAGSMWNHQFTSVTNTSVTVQLTRSTAVTVVGISVLGIATSPQAYVHLTAVPPPP